MKSSFFAWCCDLEENSGEGILAHKFLKILSENTRRRVIAQSPTKKILFNKGKKSSLIKNKKTVFKHKYISPFFGVFILWKKYFLSQNIIYVNYFPLWNIILTIILPPKTIIGPITGSIYLKKNYNFFSFIRKFIFPILYKLNLKLLFLRYKKLLFSTNLLKQYLNKKQITRSYFNFLMYDFKQKVSKTKRIDFLIYYRKHENKFSVEHTDLIKSLLKSKKKIVVFGDYLNLNNVQNLNRISRKKTFQLIKKAKFTISGDDNLYSIFNLDCSKHGVKIIYNDQLKRFLDTFNKENYISVNFKEKNYSKKLLKKINRNSSYKKTNKLFLKSLNKKIKNYFSNIELPCAQMNSN